ncbi:hypothetical protein RSOLAG1IB_04934 [Rhizoctonia solani AG-1 IB]|uniref:Uncharacterized protein n=1 Tax=Thanatephorus cucumeris (strain AG1-IB / isolate 7/3/14) TaxID=1108050 RepID=A0A0B7G281_THACB|nr:hypothetical protein RSOLAG1IB_04934 [Rhizoctonia solani AG-1 IB]
MMLPISTSEFETTLIKLRKVKGKIERSLFSLHDLHAVRTPSLRFAPKPANDPSFTPVIEHVELPSPTRYGYMQE